MSGRILSSQPSRHTSTLLPIGRSTSRRPSALEFNADKLRKITSEIHSSLERLEELQRLSRDAFLSDPHKISSAKYNFIVVIEGVIDLCNHVIAKNAFRTPEDYADTFKVMAERGAFDTSFTD